MRPFRASVLALLVLAACPSSEEKQDQAPPDPTPTPPPPVSVDAAPAPAPPPVGLEITPFDPGSSSEKDALAELGARSAWSSVIDRDRLLHRRGDSGAVVGTLRVEGEEHWLVDEGEGEGGLGVRLAGLDRAEGDLPKRLLAWGAYKDDEDGHWRFHVERAEALRDKGAASTERALFELPGEDKSSEPPKVVVASQANPAGDFIVFALERRGSRIEDGWTITDAPGGKAVARLLLPGERSPYGGQDLVAAEERWKLFRGRRYWVKVNRFRKTPGQLPVYRAKGLPAPASEALVGRLPAPPPVEESPETPEKTEE